MYKIYFNDTQNTICLIYFLSHMIFKCEITIKITPKSFMEFNFSRICVVFPSII